MRADSLFKLRCVGLDPSEDRRVVDLDSAVEEHEFQIAVADREHQIPSHGPKDRLSCELPPLEAITQTHTDARPIAPPQSYGKSASSKVCNRTQLRDTHDDNRHPPRPARRALSRRRLSALAAWPRPQAFQVDRGGRARRGSRRQSPAPRRRHRRAGARRDSRRLLPEAPLHERRLPDLSRRCAARRRGRDERAL